MAYTFIAAISIDTGDPDPTGTPGTVLTTVSSLNVAAGDSLVYVCKWEGGDTTITVDKSVGSPANTFTNRVKATHGNGDLTLAMGSVEAASADATMLVKFTLGATRSYRRMIVLQFRPDSGDTVSYDTGAIATGNGTAPNSGNITTTGPDEIAVGGYGEYSAQVTTSEQINGVSATEPTGSPAANTSAWYRILTATFTGGAASATIGATEDWACGVVALKSVAGGATTTVNLDSLTYSYSVGTNSPSIRKTAVLAGSTFSYSLGTLVPEYVRIVATDDMTYAYTLGDLSVSIRRTIVLSGLTYSYSLGDLNPDLGGGTTTVALDGLSYSYSVGTNSPKVVHTAVLDGLTYAHTLGTLVPRRLTTAALDGLTYSYSVGANAPKRVTTFALEGLSYGYTLGNMAFTGDGVGGGTAPVVYNLRFRQDRRNPR